MKSDIEIIETLSKVESVRRGDISANVRTEGQTVTAIENGTVSDPDTGNSLASFSQWHGGGLNINFHTPETDEIAILTEIKSFIQDLNE